MSNRTDQVNLIVNVQGNQAKKELNDLRKVTADISQELKGLKKGTAEYADANKRLKEATAAMSDLRKQIGLTALSEKELVAELTKLKALKSAMTPQTQAFKDMQKEIDAVSKRLYEVKNGVFGFGATLHKIKAEIMGFGAVALGALGLEFLSAQFTQIVRGAGKLSDELADIRKSTGLTDDGVKDLNKSFAELNTRTSTSDLRGIAKVGGQLGIAKEDILSFTESVDKLNVALGDEFTGGAEEITNVVGKLRNTFTDIKSDNVGDDLLRIGNALNLLGQEGIATAPIVSNLAQRIGSAGQIYGMTAGQTFGLSAAMQEMGITAERGGTAVVKVLQKLSKSPQDFAKIAGMASDEFKTLVNTNITEALQKVATGFASSKGKATEFAEKLADAEIGSAAITEVFAKLGSNTQLVTDKINLATGALGNNNSIMSEFALKNDTFGATLDKLGKEFNKLATSSAVTNFLKSATEGALTLVKVLTALPNWISANIKALLAMGAALLLVNLQAFAGAIASAVAQLATYTLSQKAATLWTTLLAGAQKLLQLAFQGTIALAAFVAYKIFELEKAQKAYLESLSASATKTKIDNETKQKALEIVKDQIVNTQLLVLKLNSENVSYTEKEKLLKQLQASSNGYLNSLTLENLKTEEGTKLLNGYINMLYLKAEAQAREQLLVDKLKKQEDLKIRYGIDDVKDVNNVDDKQTAAENAAGDDSYGGFVRSMITGNKTDRQQVNKDFDELRSTVKDIEYLTTKIATTKSSNTTTNTIGSTTSSDNEAEDKKAIALAKKKKEHAEQLAKEEREKYKKLLEDLHKMRVENEIADASDDEKERIRIREKYDKLQEDAVKYVAVQMELRKLEAKELARLQDKITEKELLELQKRNQNIIDFLDKRQKDKEDKAAAKVEELENDRAENIKKSIEDARKKREAKKDKKNNPTKVLADKIGEKIDEYSQFLNLYSNYVNAQNAIDEKQKAKIDAKNNFAKNSYAKMLKYNMLSKQQHDKLVAESDIKANALKKELALKQFNRSQQVALGDAAIGSAMGIVNIWSKYAANPIVAGILTGAMLAVFGKQIEAINSATPPEMAKGGMIVSGASHSQGGIDLIERGSGRAIANMEGGEPIMVLSKNTYKNNKSIVDSLLASSTTKNGAAIPIPNTSRLVPIITASQNIPGNIANNTTELKAMQKDIYMMKLALASTAEALQKMPKDLRAIVVNKDIREANKKELETKNKSTIRQQNLAS
jgi:TP901 family phage tail tape measure protein